MTVKNFFNRTSWIILIILFLPAGAVQASKSAIPGDRMYPVKLVLEDAVLLIMKPSSSATSGMEMKFTKRRLLEVEQVADTPFVVGSLKSLNDQVTDTTVSIGKVKNLEKQSELVNEYIQTLRKTQTSLEEQKYIAAGKITAADNYTYTTNQVVNNNYYYYSPTPQQNNSNNSYIAPNDMVGTVVQPSDPSPTQQPSNDSEQIEEILPPEEVQEKIEETQVEIEKEIKKLEEIVKENIEEQRVEAVEKLENQLQEEIEKAQKEQEEAMEEVQKASQQQTDDSKDNWGWNSRRNKKKDYDN